MKGILVFGLLVGLDNLQVGAGLGLVPMSAARRWAFAGAFALCETVMPLAGLLLGRAVTEAAGPWTEYAGIAILAATGALIVAMALGSDADAGALEKDRVVTGRLALAGLPLSLSVDNLAVGIGLGSLGFPVLASALAIGAVSGSLCALGLFAGAGARDWLRRRMPQVGGRRAELWSGVYLMLLAAGRLVGDLT